MPQQVINNFLVVQEQNLAPSPAGKKNKALTAQAPLVTLPSMTGNKGKKKRTLTMANGGAIDLLGPLTVSPEVVEALRKRILALEEELDQTRPTKRAKIMKADEDEAPVAGSSKPAPTAASKKADEKKLKANLKKVFDRLKKECKSDSNKFQGLPKTIKLDEVYSEEDFHTIFDGKGILIQPTKENKPNSVVHIINFATQAQISDFFGSELKELKGNTWTIGGGPSFSKSVKIGPCDVRIQSFEISWSSKQMKCTYKFEVASTEAYQYWGGRWF